MKKLIPITLLSLALLTGCGGNAQNLAVQDGNPRDAYETIYEEVTVEAPEEATTELIEEEEEFIVEDNKEKYEASEALKRYKKASEPKEKDSDEEEFETIPPEECPGHDYEECYDYMICRICGESIPIEGVYQTPTEYDCEVEPNECEELSEED